MGPRLLFLALVSLTCTVYGQVGEDVQMPGLPNVNDIMIENVQGIRQQQEQQRQQIQQDQQIRQQQQAEVRQQIIEQQQMDQQRQLQQQQIDQQQLLERQQQIEQQRLLEQQQINQRRQQQRGSNVQPTDRPITAGNIQVVYNDELRNMMKTYDITVDEIRKMLEIYAQGGSATITKTRKNPDTGVQEVITLDFEQFTSPSRPGGTQIPTITPDANPLPGEPIERGMKPGEGTDVISPAEPRLEELMDAEAFLRQKIRELDAQLLALDNAYRNGQLTRVTRNENAILNRQQRREAERDLRTIQQEISRMSPQARRNLPPKEVLGPADDGRINAIDGNMPPLVRPGDMDFGRGQSGEIDPTRPFPETRLPGDVSSRRMESNIRRIEEENRRLLMRLQELRRRSQMSGLFGREAGNMPRNGFDLESFGTGRPPYGRLREELLRIRAREMDILRRLRMLSSRYTQLLNRRGIPVSRDGLTMRRPLNRRISFNGGRPQFTDRRTLTGSVNGGMLQNPRMRLM